MCLAGMDIYVPCACWGPTEARREQRIPWNWTYRYLWSDTGSGNQTASILEEKPVLLITELPLQTTLLFYLRTVCKRTFVLCVHVLCLCVCVVICLCLYVCACLSLSVSFSFCVWVRVCVHVLCVSFSLLCLSVCVCVYLCLSVFICMCISLSDSHTLSVCMCLSLSFCGYLCVFVSLCGCLPPLSVYVVVHPWRASQNSAALKPPFPN